MLIEFLERYTSFIIKLSVLTYMTNSFETGGLGYSRAQTSIAYGIIELSYYFMLSTYSTGLLNLYQAIYIGVLSLFFSCVGLAIFKQLPILYITMMCLGAGTGLMKAGALHIISSLYNKKNQILNVLFTYQGIINLGSFAGNIMCAVLPIIIGYSNTYLLNSLVAFVMLAIFYTHKARVQEYALTVEKNSLTNIKLNPNFKYISVILKANTEKVIYLLIALIICGLGISISCLSVLNYLIYINKSSISLFGLTVPASIIVCSNPLLIFITAMLRFKQKQQNVNQTKVGFIVNIISYGIYMITFFAMPRICSTLFIIITAISELYININAYSGLLKIFRQIRPCDLSKIISSTYLFLGIICLINNSCTTWLIDNGFYIYQIFGIWIINILMLIWSRRIKL